MTAGEARSAPAALVLAAFAVIYLVWGTTYLATREVVAVLPPLLSRAGCCLVAGLALVLASRFAGARRPTGAELAATAATGALLFVGCHGLVSIAQRHVASGLAAVVIATIPLWIPLLSWAAPGGARPRWPVLAGAGLGVAGVAVLAGGAGTAGGLSPFWSAVLVVSALSWAAGTVLGRHLPRPRSAFQGAGWSLLAGGALLGLLGLGAGERFVVPPADWSGRVWAGLGVLVFGSYVLAFSCYIWLLERQPAERVATYAYVNPIVAVLVGAAFAGERLTWGVGLATALIVAAVALTVTVGTERAASPDDRRAPT